MYKTILLIVIGLILITLVCVPIPAPAAAPVYALGFEEEPTNTPAPAATDTPAPGATNTPSSPPAQPTAFLFDPLITKEANPENARIGDLIRFTITVSNPNTSELKNISVVDNLSLMVDFVSAVASQGDYTYEPGPHYVLFNLGTLPPHGSAVMQVTVRVNDKAQPPTELRNQAVLREDGIARFTSNVAVVRIVPELLPETGNGPAERDVAALTLSALTWAGMAYTGLAIIAAIAFGGWRLWRRIRRNPYT